MNLNSDIEIGKYNCNPSITLNFILINGQINNPNLCNYIELYSDPITHCPSKTCPKRNYSSEILCDIAPLAGHVFFHLMFGIYIKTRLNPASHRKVRHWGVKRSMTKATSYPGSALSPMLWLLYANSDLIGPQCEYRTLDGHVVSICYEYSHNLMSPQHIHICIWWWS